MTLTLDEKIGQMIVVGFRGAAAGPGSRIVDDIRRFHIGGVWLVDNDTPMGDTLGNIVSPDQVRELTARLQEASGIPLTVAIDAEGGEVIRLKEKYGFPRTLSAEELGRRDDTDLTRQHAAALGARLRDLGFSVNFAPVVDLNKNPRNRALGLKRRCYSADPEVVARHAAVVVEEHRRAGIRCVAKHFPGHGSAAGDTHADQEDVSARWNEDELLPYRELIGKGMVEGVMTAHVILGTYDPRSPATLSRTVVTGLLREKLGFDGVVVSDDFNMGAITRHYQLEDAVLMAVNAGVDMILHGNVARYDDRIAEKTSSILRSLVQRGLVPEERIDVSVGRILRFKGLPGGLTQRNVP